MRVLNREILRDFVRVHSDVSAAARTWLARTENAVWLSSEQVLATFNNASPVSKNRWVFDLRHNRYRLDALLEFRTQICVVMRLGTHQEYDKWSFDE